MTRANATGLALAIHPVNGRADAHPKLLRRPITRHAPSQNGSNYPLAEIDRIRLAHPCWPPIPASMVNQKLADLGIPNRFNLSSSRFSRRYVTVAATDALLPAADTPQ